MNELYLGLISGTSMDGIDAVLARFDERSLALVATLKHDYPDELQRRLRAAVRHPERCGVDDVGELDAWVGECFGEAALRLIESSKSDIADIRAIGSHGQTLRHRPDAAHPFSLQIGNPAAIAAATGVDTVADFRCADLALGGQGAPLVPPFHHWLFRARDEDRVIVNIGGIANVTVLPAGPGAVTGFDTGPGNTLLDAWILRQQQRAFDADGAWSRTGSVDADLLARMLAHPFFDESPPKSTGVEVFNLDWLAQFGVDDRQAEDVQATLAELTATGIAQAIMRWAAATSRVFVCGGGVHNADLLARLSRQLGDLPVESTACAGLDPDWVEAAAFAWLAMRRIEGLPGNLPSVTGAAREALLGAVYAA